MADRNTNYRESNFLVLPVEANTRIETGKMVAVNAAGRAVPASNAVGLRGAGMAVDGVDNIGGAAGAKKIEVRRGIFGWSNSGISPVTQAMVMNDCYIEDDETVRAFNDAPDAPNPRAGRVVEVSANTVWVEQPSTSVVEVVIQPVEPEIEPDTLGFPVAAGTVIEEGQMVALDADGYAVPAANTEGFKAAGRAAASVDNTEGSNGDETIEVERGIIEWNNSATDPVTQAMALGDCYIEDDETVRAFDETPEAPNPKAGRVIEVSSEKVRVEQP